MRIRWGKHWEQDWANEADVRQVQRDNQGREEHKNTGGKPNTGNTGEQKKGSVYRQRQEMET